MRQEALSLSSFPTLLTQAVSELKSGQEGGDSAISSASSGGQSLLNSSVYAQTVVASQINSSIEVPEFIYATIRKQDFAMIATLPNIETEIPVNYTVRKPEVDDRELLLKFRNNGLLYLRRRPDFNLNEMIEILRISREGEIDENQLAIDAYRILEFRCALNVSQRAELDLSLLQRGVDLDNYRADAHYNFSKRPSFESVVVHGTEYSLGDFKARFHNLFNIPFEFDLGTENLYRAVTVRVWELIQEKGHFLIRDRDNFEASIGPQVSRYAQEEGYAGVIIKIPIKGHYFMPAGLQVPRISCAYPHYIDGNEIEVSYDMGRSFKALNSEHV